MKRDSRLSGVLHCLLHMAELGRPATSEWLAQAMQTNPVVIRRLMAGLRDAGFVASAKGHGGGWLVSCLVEQAVNAALEQAYRDAEAVLLARLGSVSLAALARDFHRRLVATGRSLAEVSHDV